MYIGRCYKIQLGSRLLHTQLHTTYVHTRGINMIIVITKNFPESKPLALSNPVPKTFSYRNAILESKQFFQNQISFRINPPAPNPQTQVRNAWKKKKKKKKIRLPISKAFYHIPASPLLTIHTYMYIGSSPYPSFPVFFLIHGKISAGGRGGKYIHWESKRRCSGGFFFTPNFPK